jgi:hypothetical protein
VQLKRSIRPEVVDPANVTVGGYEPPCTVSFDEVHGSRSLKPAGASVRRHQIARPLRYWNPEAEKSGHHAVDRSAAGPQSIRLGHSASLASETASGQRRRPAAQIARSGARSRARREVAHHTQASFKRLDVLSGSTLTCRCAPLGPAKRCRSVASFGALPAWVCANLQDARPRYQESRLAEVG